MPEIYYYIRNGAIQKIHQKNLEMLWVAVEQKLFEFAENKRTDPRYNENDWRGLLAIIEGFLEGRLPKKL